MICVTDESKQKLTSTVTAKEVKDIKELQLYGKEIDEIYRPSRNATSFPDEMAEQDKANRDFFKTQKVRDVIRCGECQKPRMIYSDSKLSLAQEEILQHFRASGDFMFGDPLRENCEIVERRCLSCSSEVEVTYYTASLRSYLPPICIYCGKDDDLLDDNDPYIQDLLEKYSIIRPLCEICHRQGKEAKTWGRKFFKKQRKD